MDPRALACVIGLGLLLGACGREEQAPRRPIVPPPDVGVEASPSEDAEPAADAQATDEPAGGREEESTTAFDAGELADSDTTGEDEAKDASDAPALAPTAVADQLAAWLSGAPAHLRLIVTLREGERIHGGLDEELSGSWVASEAPPRLFRLELGVLHESAYTLAHDSVSGTELVVADSRRRGRIAPGLLAQQESWRVAVEADLARLLDLPALVTWLRQARGWQVEPVYRVGFLEPSEWTAAATLRGTPHASSGAVRTGRVIARVSADGRMLGLRVEVRRWTTTAGLLESTATSPNWGAPFPTDRSLGHPKEVDRELVSEGSPLPGETREVLTEYSLTQFAEQRGPHESLPSDRGGVR